MCAAVILALLAAACSDDAGSETSIDSPDAGVLRVAVVNHPLECFATFVK